MNTQALVNTLSLLRLRTQPDEWQLHTLLRQFFDEQSIPYQAEYVLAPRCRIDFLIGTIGLEVKRGHPRARNVARQLSRYAESAEIQSLVLLSEHTLSLPKTFYGKPLYQVSLSRLWGIAL